MLVICFSKPVIAQTPIRVPDSLLYRQLEPSMYKLHSEPFTEGCDSVYLDYWGKFYYNSDTLFYRIATQPLEEIYAEVWLYYFIIDHAYERFPVERKKLQAAAKRYKSKALERELDIFYARYNYDIDQPSTAWDFTWSLIDKYERKNDLQTKLRIMQHLVFSSIGFPNLRLSSRIENEHLPFIKLIDECFLTLKRTGKNYLEPGYFYHRIGITYYEYKFYNKAIPLLWKTLEQPVYYYHDRSLMKARDYLGDYYSTIGDYNLSDSLYFSMLQCSDSVLMRNVDDAIAIGGLARNAMLRKENEEAIRLYNAALYRALQVKDSTLAGGYAVRLGHLFLEKNQIGKAEEMVHSARKCLIAGKQPVRNWKDFYTLCRDYSLKTNKIDNVTAYIDSIAIIQAQEDNIYNAHALAYAEQEAFEMENAFKEKQISMQKTRLVLISIILVLCLITLSILIYSYRKKQERNRRLYRQIKEQDHLAEELELMTKHCEQLSQLVPKETQSIVSLQNEKGSMQQRQLVALFCEYLHNNRNYTKPNLNIDEIVAALATNKTYLFEAVKIVTNKTPKDYIRSMQLEAAKQMLETNFGLSMETIAEECGFNTRNTFYRLFLERYQITPAEYRKMTKK